MLFYRNIADKTAVRRFIKTAGWSLAEREGLPVTSFPAPKIFGARLGLRPRLEPEDSHPSIKR